MHGLGISRRIAQVTRGTFQVKPGSLFPALHRMDEAGWLSSSWGESENSRRAKFYRLTPERKKQLLREEWRWTELVNAIGRVMKPTPAAGSGE